MSGLFLSEVRIVDIYGNEISAVGTESGRALNIYQTGIDKGGQIHFHVNNLTVGTYLFILIDISDTENYNHAGINYAHLEHREIGVTCDNQGDFTADVVFIENVSTTGANEYVWDHWSGDKDTGNNIDDHIVLFPVGPHLVSSKFTTHNAVFSDDWKSSVSLPSTTSPGQPNVYPGNGDVALRVNVTSGTVKGFKVNLGYHSH